jgi:transposase-like protein
MQFKVIDVNCPRCRKAISLATIEVHPTRPEIAHQNYMCVDCGPVITKIISLREKNAQVSLVRGTHESAETL